MFDKAIQSAPSLEILSPQGANLTAHCKTTGGVQRVYDRVLKGYVYHLVNNGTQTMVQLPKDDKAKQGLGLVQPCLVLQVFLPLARDKPFALEVGVTDSSRARRKILFSASFHEAQSNTPQPNSLHARFPLSGLRRGAWLNLCLDVDALVKCSFGQVMKSVDSISVHAECRLRRIFTMRNQLLQSETLVSCATDVNVDHEYEQLAPGARFDAIPRSYEFPAGVDQHTQLIGPEQVVALPDEMPRSKEQRMYSAACPDTAHVSAQCLEDQTGQDTIRFPDHESEELGGHPADLAAARRQDLSLEPLPAGVARAAESAIGSADPVGYEEMIRRARLERASRDEKDQRRSSRTSAECADPRTATSAGLDSTAERPECRTLPEAMVSARSAAPRARAGQCREKSPGAPAFAEKSGKGGPAPRSAGRDAPGKAAAATAASSLQAVCHATTAPRRKAQRRPMELSGLQARNPSHPGSRFPNSAIAMERSPSYPSNPRPRPSRPLPLEIGAPRSTARDDGASSAPCSSSSSSGAAFPHTAGATRRGHHPQSNHLPTTTAGKASSPTSTATMRRRRELNKQKTDKMAEIYGVHKHATLPKSADRGPDERRGTPGPRPIDEEDAESIGVASPPAGAALPEVARSMRLAAGFGDGQQQAPHLEDDALEPAAGPNLEALPEFTSTPPGDVSMILQAAIALGQAPPSSTLPPYAQERRRRPLNLEAEPHSRSQTALVSATGEVPDCGPHTPASSASLASPSRVLGARAEATDVIIFEEGSSTFSSPLTPDFPAREVPSNGGDGPPIGAADAWSAFGSTVRHHNPFMGARPNGFPGAWPSSPQESAQSRAQDPDPSSAASTARDEHKAVATDRFSKSERGEAIGGIAAYAPPQRRNIGDRDGLDSGSGSIDSNSVFGGASYFGIDKDLIEGTGDVSRTSTREDLRRIKSLSPPRRSWRTRPEPIGTLESPSQLGPGDPSAPSSAPSECEQRASRQQAAAAPGLYSSSPFAHQNEPSVSVGGFRPFTPPVVPVGKLLRSVYDSARGGAPVLGGPLSARDSARSGAVVGAGLMPRPLEAVQDFSLPLGACKEPPVIFNPDGALRVHRVDRISNHGHVSKDPSVPDVHENSPYPELALDDRGPPYPEMLEAIYDSVLDVFYDPRSNQYYERRHDGPANVDRKEKA